MFSLSFLEFTALLAATAFEGAALVELVLFPYWPADFARVDEIEASVFRALAPLSPGLLLLVLYAWVFGLVTVIASRRSERFSQVIRNLSFPLQHFMISIHEPENMARLRVLRHPRFLVAMGIVAAALLGFVPYRPDLNPNGNPTGIDTPLYIDWVSQMLQRPLGEAILYAFGEASRGSRPLLLLCLYAGAYIGGGAAESVVKLQPLIMGPLLVLSSFLLVRVGFADERRAAIAALIASFSFPITVGLWAGYFANWLALIESNLLLASFLGLLGSHSIRGYAVSLSLSLALLLTHPWTWVLVLVAMTVFTLFRWRNERDFSPVRWAGSFVIAGLLVDIVRGQISGGWSIGADLSTKTSVAGLSQLLTFWPSVIEALMITYDGLLGQPILFALAFLALPALKLRANFDGLLICWVAVSSVPFAFFNSFHMGRIVYDLPVAILASIGLMSLLSSPGKNETSLTMTLVAIMLFSANYALRAVIQLAPP